MSIETNAVVTLPVDLFVCRIYMCLCVNCVCECFELSVCVCMTMYLFVLCVCLSFSGPLSAPFGPWRCDL